MDRSKPAYRSRFLIRFLLALAAAFPLFVSAQSTLQTFLDSALILNPQAVSIHTQISSYQYDNQMIDVVLRSPKAFVSADLLVAPYYNNNGKLIDTVLQKRLLVMMLA